jgi:hypothetical protein
MNNEQQVGGLLELARQIKQGFRELEQIEGKMVRDFAYRLGLRTQERKTGWLNKSHNYLFGLRWLDVIFWALFIISTGSVAVVVVKFWKN